jgi:hypothetical protein
MRALKTIVITLGVVLLGGMGLLIYGLSQNWHRAADAPPRPGPAVTAPLATGWGRVALGDATGSRVGALTAAGDLVAVHLRGERGDRVVIVDPRTGSVVGTFTVGDAP